MYQNSEIHLDNIQENAKEKTTQTDQHMQYTHGYVHIHVTVIQTYKVLAGKQFFQLHLTPLQA